MTAPAPEDRAYVGWLRVNSGPWKEVCHGPDLDTCLDRLLNVPPTCLQARGIDRLVLPAGRHPDERRR